MGQVSDTAPNTPVTCVSKILSFVSIVQMYKASRSTKYRYYKRSVKHFSSQSTNENVQIVEDANKSHSGRAEMVPSPSASSSPLLADTNDLRGSHDSDDEFSDACEDACDWLADASISENGTDSDVSQDCREDSEDMEGGAENDGLRHKLAEWAVEYCISHTALMALLAILSIHSSLSLPRHVSTLFQTAQLNKPIVMGEGEYHYFGLRPAISGLLQRLPGLPHVHSLHLQVNVDGLPLFKSSSLSLWPILGMLKNVSRHVFPIALFCGKQKPPLDAYLKDFVSDCQNLCENGLTLGDQTFSMVLDSLVCDAPARAFLKCIKGHSGYYACERCEQKGVHISGRLTFPEMHAEERTQQSFVSMRNELHHHGTSPLLSVPLDLVRNVPLDYMHLCCLGVMKLMIRLWLCGPLPSRLPARAVHVVSERLCGLRHHVPSEFARKPRSLYEFRMWKATELRQFMIYTGIIALKDVIPQEMYELFLLYSGAMTILLTNNLAKKHASYARELLGTFVKNFTVLFGSTYVGYNVHSLVHLADDAEMYGALDTISCFPYENYLCQLKRGVRRPTAPTAQLMRRIAEHRTYGKVHCAQTNTYRLAKEHASGPVPCSGIDHVRKQYRQMKGIPSISTYDGDNCVLIDSTDVAVVKNILKTTDTTLLVVQRFLVKEAFYSYPFDSSTLGIFKLSTPSQTLTTVPVGRTSTIRKCILAKVGEQAYVSVPVLHDHLS